MGQIQIDFSTENSFSQNQNTRAVNLAKPVQNTPFSQGSSPAPFSLQSQTKQDNVHISRSAQLIQQNTAPFSAHASADTTANARSVALQNGTLSLTQSEKNGITSDYQWKNGTNFQFTINQNINLQENEDQSTSVFFEQDNISKKYHANGNISKYQENILDGNKKSVRINAQGGTLNAENDTVFALADNTTVNAKGNNTIILKNTMRDMQINTQNGDNTIVGQTLQNVTISLTGGKNTLNFKNAENSIIDARKSNVHLNTGKLAGSTLNLEKGTHVLNIQQSSHNTIHFASGSFNQESKLNIFGKTENTLIHASGEKVNLSLQHSQNNYIQSTAKFTHATFSKSKSDVVQFNTYSSIVSTGTLTDSNMEINGTQTVNMRGNALTGNSNLALSGHSASLALNTLSENAAANIDTRHFAHSQIQNISGNATLDIQGGYYNNLAVNTLKDTAFANISGDGAVSVNTMKDNAGINLGEGILNVTIGAVSDNAVIQGGKNALQSRIGASSKADTEQNQPGNIHNTFQNTAITQNQEQTRAFNAYRTTANNFPNIPNGLQNQIKLNRLV